MNKKAINTIKYSLSFVLAAVLVYFAFSKVSWDAFLSGLGSTRWAYILLFVVASVLALVFRVERWALMMHPVDPEVKKFDAWDANNIGNVANVAIPGAGEFIRCGYVKSKKMNYETALGTIVCERAWDMLAVLLLIGIALVAKWENVGGFFQEKVLGAAAGGFNFGLIYIFAALGVAGISALWVVWRFRSSNKLCGKVFDMLKGLWGGFISFTQCRSKLLFVCYTIGIWLCYVLMTYFVFLAVPALSALGFADALLISAMGNIASVIPVPGGIGAYHYIVALTLQSVYGISWDTGILFATLNHELHAILVILLGAISYLRITSNRRKHHETQNS